MSEPTNPTNPANPRDQQWLQEMCELVKAKIPDSHAFVVFAFPLTSEGRLYYASNAGRASTVAALSKWLEHQKKMGTYLQHEDDWL